MARRTYKRREKLSSWRKLKISRKIKHRLKILGLALLVVFCAIVVSGAVALYQFFSKPMATASGAANGEVAFPGRRFNLLLVNLEDANDPTSLIKQLSIISIDAGDREPFPIRLPLGAEVVVPQGFGGHKLSTVYSLGALTKPLANLDLTAQTVSQLLAVPIDGYIVTDDAGLGQISRHILECGGIGCGWRMVRLLPNLFTELRRSLKTNLTLPALLRIGQFVWSARPATSEDVAGWEISEEELFDWQHLDLKLQECFTDSEIVEERLKIQVLNGTEKQGLATHVARYVKNLGGDVIIISNFDRSDVRQSFMVYGLDESYTVERLKEVLQIQEVRPGQVGTEERADLTIILGLDSWKNL